MSNRALLPILCWLLGHKWRYRYTWQLERRCVRCGKYQAERDFQN